jgi:hypothetical protein
MTQRYHTRCTSCKYLGYYNHYDLFWCKSHRHDYKNLIVRAADGDSHFMQGAMCLYEQRYINQFGLTSDEMFDIFLLFLKLLTEKKYIRYFEELNSD